MNTVQNYIIESTYEYDNTAAVHIQNARNVLFSDGLRYTLLLFKI